MPILDLQRRVREIGRIRIGNQVTAKGRQVPNKLDTFRLTSPSRELIVAAAIEWGGLAKPWRNGDADEYEVITETAVLDIAVPPWEAVTQWNEMWTGGGCLRRCDGVTNVVDMTPCACPADRAVRRDLAAKGQACKETTRLQVLLTQLPDLGTWRLESHGYYAAVELAGAAEVLAIAAQRGRIIPARLRLDQREKKVPGKPTNRYVVPVIEFVETTLQDLLVTTGSGPAIGPPPARPALPATTVPDGSEMRAQPAQNGPGAAGEREAVHSVTTPEPLADGPVSPEQLAAGITRLGSDPERVRAIRRAMFPPGDMSDQERRELLDALEEEAARK